MKNHPVGRSTTGQVYSQLAVLSFSIQPGELIQIISTGQGHWVAIFTIGTSHPIVNVYASLYSCAGAHLKVQRCCCNGNWEARAYPQIHGCIHKLWINSTFGYLNTLGSYCVGKQVHACRIQQLKWPRGARHEKTSPLFMNLFTCNVIHAHMTKGKSLTGWFLLVASRHDHDRERQIALFLGRWVLTENEFDHLSIQ